MRSSQIFIPSEWIETHRKKDVYLKADGSNPFSANLNANSHGIENLGVPVFDHDAVSKRWVELNFFKISDDKTVDFKNSRLVNIAYPLNPNDGAIKGSRLLCSGTTSLSRESKLNFDQIHSSMPEISDALVFAADVTSEVKTWFRLDENRATSFTIEFFKNRDVLFSKYYNYNSINLESSNEFCTFIERFHTRDQLSIIVAADASIQLHYFMTISNLKTS